MEKKKLTKVTHSERQLCYTNKQGVHQLQYSFCRELPSTFWNLTKDYLRHHRRNKPSDVFTHSQWLYKMPTLQSCPTPQSKLQLDIPSGFPTCIFIFPSVNTFRKWDNYIVIIVFIYKLNLNWKPFQLGLHYFCA